MDILERLKEAEEFISAARSQLTEGVFGRVLCDKVLTEFEIEDIVLSQRSVEWAPEPNHFSKYYTKNDPNRLPIRQRFPDEHFQYDDPKSRVQEVDRSQIVVIHRPGLCSLSAPAHTVASAMIAPKTAPL